jgi:hypothetical protein
MNLTIGRLRRRGFFDPDQCEPIDGVTGSLRANAPCLSPLGKPVATALSPHSGAAGEESISRTDRRSSRE